VYDKFGNSPAHLIIQYNCKVDQIVRAIRALAYLQDFADSEQQRPTREHCFTLWLKT
jgi:hypothetical protein